jgi:hypothetical protein
LLEILGQKELCRLADFAQLSIHPSAAALQLADIAVAKRLCFNSTSGKAVDRVGSRPNPFAAPPVDVNCVLGVARANVTTE